MSANYNYQDYLAELEAHGGKMALVDGASGASLSYRQLIDLSHQVANYFLVRKFEAGDRLLIIGVRGIDWAPIFFATQLAGIVAVPIDTRASNDLVRAVIKKTTPVAIIQGKGVGFKTRVRTIPVSQVLDSASQSGNVQPLPALKPGSFGQILLSSGTWSQPKGVTLTQDNLLQNMLAAGQVYSLDPQEILLSILPLSHAYEQMCGLHIPLRAGCTIVYLDEIRADKIKAAIKQYQISLIVAVPRILDLFQRGILRQAPPARRDKIISLSHRLRALPVGLRRLVFRKVHQGLGPSLRTLMVGGAALPLETDHFFQGLGYQVLVGYGLSETSPIISILVRQRGRQLGDVGRILANLEAQVNDDGELLVRGPTVFAGYWPDRRHHRSWFNTGDVVELDSQGWLRIMGRSKDLIVFVSGDKIMAGEAEELIARHLPRVEEAIVMSINDRAGTSEGLHIAYKSSRPVSQRQFEQLFRLYLPRGAQILSVRNVHPEFLSRTHTIKLARQDNYDRFVASQVRR